MRRMKKMLVFLTGLAVLFCAGSAFAEKFEIEVPYALHGGDWWSGLALSNTGDSSIDVGIWTYNSGVPVKVGALTLEPFSMKTRMLPDFFTEMPYPTADGGRVSLGIVASGNEAKRDFKFTLFVGSPQGFSFQSYDFSNARYKSVVD
ncbi:MAG: hypothetical protein Q4B25_09940 [Pseudomonadota bacterium]|nr:hypothetical protein [Pseudomonadota bacterium]